MKEIIIATKNQGKVNEFRQLFAPYNIKVQSLLNISLPDVEETGQTFKENARIKAKSIAEMVQKPVLADDSGLVIDALDGKPGVYSARYAGEPTSDKQNYEKVLNEMKSVPEHRRTARFVCVLAFAIPHKETIFKEGFCEGKIAMEPAGVNGFGYDPIFIPNGYTITMAQFEDHEKNQMSHRYHAMIQLKNWLDIWMNKGEWNE